MQALPMMTPSMVNMARTLFARRACRARLQVSPISSGLFRRMVSGAFTDEWEARAGFGDSRESFTVCITRSMRALLEVFQARLGFFITGVQLQSSAILFG